MSESCRIELQEFSRIQRVIGRQYGVLVCNILPDPIVDLSMSIFSGDQYHNRVEMVTWASVSWLAMDWLEH